MNFSIHPTVKTVGFLENFFRKLRATANIEYNYTNIQPPKLNSDLVTSFEWEGDGDTSKIFSGMYNILEKKNKYTQQNLLQIIYLMGFIVV